MSVDDSSVDFSLQFFLFYGEEENLYGWKNPNGILKMRKEDAEPVHEEEKRPTNDYKCLAFDNRLE